MEVLQAASQSDVALFLPLAAHAVASIVAEAHRAGPTEVNEFLGDRNDTVGLPTRYVNAPD